jgi:hypothetical protein
MQVLLFFILFFSSCSRCTPRSDLSRTVRCFVPEDRKGRAHDTIDNYKVLTS